MKKTLVALAVLAASGASFAQATITGTVASGWKSTSDVNGNLSSGLGVDTAEFYLNASEDLGGGLTAKAKLGLSKVDRGNSGAGTASGAAGNGLDSFATGGDTSLSIGGGFGTVTMFTNRGADYLAGGIANPGGFAMDGKVFGARTVRDALRYASPTFGGGFSVSATHWEQAAGNGLAVGTAGAGSTTQQRANVGVLGYSAGPLKVDFQYWMWDNQALGTTTAEVATGSQNKTTLRLSGQYDLGVVAIGAGAAQVTQVHGTDLSTLIGLSVPLGKTTLGATYANRNLSGYGAGTAAQGNGTYAGWGLTASYALSKRTSVYADYGRWDTAVDMSGKSTSSQTTLLLVHGF